MAKAKRSSKRRSGRKGKMMVPVTRDMAGKIQVAARQFGLTNSDKYINLDAINDIQDPKLRKVMLGLANRQLRKDLGIAVALREAGLTQKELAVAVRGLLDGRSRDEIERDMDSVRSKSGAKAGNYRFV